MACPNMFRKSLLYFLTVGQPHFSLIGAEGICRKKKNGQANQIFRHCSLSEKKKKAFSCFEPALCKMVVLFFYKNFYQYSSAVLKCVE